MDRGGDTELLTLFLSELKSKMSAEKQLIVTVTPQATIFKRYNFANLNRFYKNLYYKKF